MFNKTSYSPEITFNSVSGTLVKSTKDSNFIRFDMKSEMAKVVFEPCKPRLSEYGKEIEVLQVMLCGSGQFLVEYQFK